MPIRTAIWEDQSRHSYIEVSVHRVKLNICEQGWRQGFAWLMPRLAHGSGMTFQTLSSCDAECRLTRLNIHEYEALGSLDLANKPLLGVGEMPELRQLTISCKRTIDIGITPRSRHSAEDWCKTWALCCWTYWQTCHATNTMRGVRLLYVANPMTWLINFNQVQEQPSRDFPS